MLWSLVLLAALTAGLGSAGRTDLQLAANLRAAAVAEAAADGAISLAAFRLLDPEAAWPADGSRIVTDRPGARLTLCIVDEAGKINPNTASPGLLEALLAALGADATEAKRLAASIYDWRSGGDAEAKRAQYRLAGRTYGPAGAPFTSVPELGLVLGMTPALLDRIGPYLTVLSDDEPNPRAASPVVLAAMRALVGFDPPGPADNAPPRVVTVTAMAETSGGRFVRRAALRLDARAVQVLTWEEGEAAEFCR